MFVAALCLFLGSAVAFAQTGATGTLTGVVTDSSGASIAGATVEVTDSGTKKVRTVTTNGEGGFTIPLLDPGAYEVKVTAPQFKTYSTKDIKIEVGRDYRLNVELNPGDVGEVIEVSAGGAALVNANNASLSTTVNQKQILELPLNGRNPLNLLALQAGVSSNGAQNTSINGLRTTSTNITRDGINVQDAFIRTNATDFAPQRPSVDDTAEFTITTSNADASLGYGASQIQIVTPRGQSQYHGAAFIFNRNSELGANSFFNNRAGRFVAGDREVNAGLARVGDMRLPLPFRNRNNYGGRISGPVPGTKKVFFFFSFEGLKDRLSGQQNRTVLTPLARSGGFQYLDNTPTSQGGPVLRTIPNLLQFARDNNIPGAATLPQSIDSVILSRFINPSPASNISGGDGRNTGGYQFNAKQNQDRNAYATRVDYEINEQNAIFGIYTYNFETNLRPDVDASGQSGNNGFNAVPSSNQTARNQLVSAGWRYTPKPNLTNELRGGFFKTEVPFNRNVANPAFFVNLGVVDSPEVGFQDQGRNTLGINIQDNATWTLGNHTLAFGFQSQLFYVDAFNAAGTVPTFNIGTNNTTPAFTTTNSTFPGGISAAQLNVANQLLALYGGIITSGTQSFNVTSLTSGFSPVRRFQPFRYSNHAGYFQDTWRIRPNLTANLGVRYEVYPAMRLDNGLALEPLIPNGTTNIRQAILDPNGRYGPIGSVNGNKSYYRTDYGTVAPVLSLSYSPNFKNRFLNAILPGEGKTVIRGGYRQSFINDSLVTVLNNAANGNAGLGTTNSSALVNGSPVLNLRLGTSTLPGFNSPVLNTNRSFLDNNGAAFGNFGTVFAIDPNLKTPRVNEYNVGIQREIGFDTAIEIRYVGTKSTNLWRGVDLNQIDIFSNGFLADFNRARNNLALATAANASNPAIPVSGAFNPAVAGSVQLTVFPQLVSGGLLNNATIVNLLRQGQPGALAFTYISNALNGPIPFRANASTGAANLVENSGFSSYHSLQAEVRKRFSRGLFLQANYTYGKVLTNTQGISQANFEPLLDNNQPNLEKARAPFDTTHAFNFNSIYELPFGKGKTFFGGAGRVMNAFIGGWQVVGILAVTSGAPINIVDTTGTFQRAGRGLQTATTSLSRDEIRDLTGFFDFGARGIRFFNPTILNSTTGRASEGGGTTPFAGQVFFNADPGRVGNLGRFSINGPIYVNLDASLVKNFSLTERVRLQLRLEGFNILNRTNFFVGQTQNINSAAFGQITSTFGARVFQIGGRIDF